MNISLLVAILSDLWRGHKPYNQYPKRVCRTRHHCQICNDTIHLGEEYFDGGFNRRVHVTCYHRAKLCLGASVSPQSARRVFDMNEEQKKYVELVASMSVDCLSGGITYETFLANLDMIVMQLQEMEWEPPE